MRSHKGDICCMQYLRLLWMLALTVELTGEFHA